jgi:transcriptional regulator with XRE-family HTH domain
MRKERGFTQEQAAERIGVHPVHVARMEAGNANVTFATMVAIAEAYGVTLEALFG